MKLQINNYKAAHALSLAVGIILPCTVLFSITPARTAVWPAISVVLCTCGASFIWHVYCRRFSAPVENVIPESIETLMSVHEQVERMTMDLVNIMGNILKKTTEGSDEANAVVNYFIGSQDEQDNPFGASYISQMIEKNENVLETTGSLFKDIGDMNKDLLQRVDEAVSKIEGIHEFVSQINNSAIQTRILALNAMIEAARAGEFAAGFAVVADEVKRMADKSDTIATNISRVAEDSKTIMEALQSNMKIKVAESITGMDNIKHDLMDTFGTLKTGIDNISEAIEVVTLNYQSIAREIKSVIVSLQYQDITAQKISSVISGMSGLKSLFGNNNHKPAMTGATMPKHLAMAESADQKPAPAAMNTLKIKPGEKRQIYTEDEIEDDVTFF